MKFPITKPSITSNEINKVLDAAKNGWGKNSKKAFQNT